MPQPIYLNHTAPLLFRAEVGYLIWLWTLSLAAVGLIGMLFPFAFYAPWV